MSWFRCFDIICHDRKTLFPVRSQDFSGWCPEKAARSLWSPWRKSSTRGQTLFLESILRYTHIHTVSHRSQTECLFFSCYIKWSCYHSFKCSKNIEQGWKDTKDNSIQYRCIVHSGLFHTERVSAAYLLRHQCYQIRAFYAEQKRQCCHRFSAKSIFAVSHAEFKPQCSVLVQNSMKNNTFHHKII